MSFSERVKDEFLNESFNLDCCVLSFISSLIHTGGSIKIANKSIGAEIVLRNDKVLQRLKKLILRRFNVDCQLEGQAQNFYVLKIDACALEILLQCQILEYEDNCLQIVEGAAGYLTENECCKKAYLKGAFLGGGALALPNKSGYSLEFKTSNEVLAKDLTNLLNYFGFSANTAFRANSYFVYVKNSEHISDFLALMQAPCAVLELQNLILSREMSNNTNRQNNCIIANAIKNFDTAINQVNNIKLIDQKMGLKNLAPALFEAANLRLNNPDLSLEELSKLADISKSGMNHRFRKLKQIAESLI